MHYVYIIHSPDRDIFYIGESTNPYKRCDKHNQKHKGYTSGKGPWTVVYVEVFKDRKEAKQREKFLKKTKEQSILQKTH